MWCWPGGTGILNKTVTVLCTIIMVHKSTSNFYRSVNCILLEYANSVCNPFKKGDVEDIGKIKKILLQCYMSLQYTWSMLTWHFSNNLSEKNKNSLAIWWWNVHDPTVLVLMHYRYVTDDVRPARAQQKCQLPEQCWCHKHKHSPCCHLSER